MDTTTPALGLLFVPAIRISNNVPVILRFKGAANLLLGNDADTSISITGGGGEASTPQVGPLESL